VPPDVPGGERVAAHRATFDNHGMNRRDLLQTGLALGAAMLAHHGVG
jgi:hypothetical protein